MASTILVVDDDPIQCGLLGAMLRRFGYEARIAESGEQGFAALRRAEGIDLVILDLALRDLDGMAVLARMREAGWDTPVIVQAAPGSVDAVMGAVRAGASDFVVKPVGAERLAVSIRNALARSALGDELRRAGRRASGVLAFRDLASNSPDMGRAIRLAERAAKSAVPVLLEGEPGTGKEALARAIQGSGDRRGRAFVAVNCGALSPDLVEPTLFGQEKDGATERQVGKFVEASGGTLFLQAVDALPAGAQARLLRAIGDGEIEPVGGRKGVRVDVRLIAATSHSLLELVKAGRFREDLYYRLNVLPVTLPPLRARPEDVPELARSFLARFAAEEGKRVRGIAPEAMALIARYDWPGTVHQLENALFRAVVLAERDELTVAEFPQIAARVEGFDVRIPPAPAGARGGAPIREIVRVEVRDPHAVTLVDDDGEVRKLEEVETAVIRFALAHYRGRMSEVSRRLGIGRSTLYRKLKDLGLAETPDAAA